jgi:hypothetical protein
MLSYRDEFPPTMPTSARRNPRLALAGGSGGDGGDGGNRQNLVMTPQLKRAIELLQLTRLQLIEEIRKECDPPQHDSPED